MAAGSCFALYARNRKEKAGIVLLSGLGGALPDIDAISLWSRFDPTVGRWFALSQPGKVIYSETYWYSHHGFMHSLVAALVFACIIGVIMFLLAKKKPDGKYNKLLLGGFTAGFIMHLLGDMVTPAGSWGGIRLFFPSSVYVGGTGNVWWWNNYDVFLITTGVLFVNLILLALSSSTKDSLRKAGLFVFIIGFVAATVQIKTRPFDFNRKSFEACEERSKTIQQDILGTKLYGMMARFDRWLIIYF